MDRDHTYRAQLVRVVQLPTTRGGIKDYAPRNFAYYLVWAIRWHIGPEYVSTYYDSLYVQLYQELAVVAGYTPSIQAAQAGLEFTRERDALEPNGPPRLKPRKYK